MARPAFAEVVRDAQRRGKLILTDGPMGTELVQSGLDLTKELTSEWNLTRPEAVKVVYEDYTNAGAEVLTTNTFSSHLAWLRGDANWREQVRAALDLCAQPEWDHLYCLGSLGTAVGTDGEAVSAMAQVWQQLRGRAAIMLETQTRLDRVKQLLEELAYDEPVQPHTPLIISFSFSRLRGTEETWVVETINGASLTATDVGRWAQERRGQLLALGTNCGTNLRLADHLHVVRAFRAATELPILLRPGITPTIECEFTPKEYAEQVRAFADAGVTLLGGCCGTTPAHLAALRKEIDRLGLGWQEE
jgi:5-methyltetrahydrofolate--homocysteine methyltransferase